jgi:hypothetical protein
MALAAAFAAVCLASCQTSADEVLSLGDATASAKPATTAPGGKTFQDPYVVAVSGQSGAVAEPAMSQNYTAPARLKRQPVPMAAAFADIAEPPPEVLALQQQAGQEQQQRAGQTQPPQQQADLGEIIMQPAAVNAASNSLFSAGQGARQSQQSGAEPATTRVAAAGAAASPSLVPGDMPTLGVNAMSKSLFSPSAAQQALMQQQALREQTTPASTETMPISEPAVTSGEEAPVLKKLSDPRPKRKILALREPTSGVPDRVDLTPEQLQAMGAVPAYDPAEPLPSDEQPVPTAEGEAKKKSWLPSLSALLKGGTKTEKPAPTP